MRRTELATGTARKHEREGSGGAEVRRTAKREGGKKRTRKGNRREGKESGGETETKAGKEAAT